MTDAAYVCRQTELERKRSARGAFSKKNGCRSKKCTLPSDRLTDKQRKELNGKMITYNLSKPMTWIEFLQLPLDVQEQYITGLIEKYGARRVDIIDMMGVPLSTFAQYMQRKFKGKAFWDGKASPHTPTQEWIEWLGASEVSLPSEDAIVQPEPSPAVKQATPVDTTEVIGKLTQISLNVMSGSLKYEGDPYAIFEKALMALDPSVEYEIMITFHRKEDDDGKA